MNRQRVFGSPSGTELSSECHSLRLPAIPVAIALLFVAAQANACTSFCLSTDADLIFGSNLEAGMPRVNALVYINAGGVEKHGWEPSIEGRSGRVGRAVW